MLRLATRSRGWAAQVAVISLLLVATGCGDEVKPVTIAPDEAVKKASEAIQKPQTFHFSLDTTKMHRLPGIWITKADGDVMKPDKLVGNLNALYNGITLSAEVVVDGESQYWTDPLNKRWGPLPSYFNVAQLFDPAKGISDILAGLKEPVVDGEEKLGDVATYRLRGKVPPDSLRAITAEVNVKADIPTTIWVGKDDFLLRRVYLQGPLIEGEPEEIGRTINISDYDKPVKVETPVIQR